MYLPVLSECLSPHVDACQIERGPGFIDWVITQVAVEGLVEFRSVWVILGGLTGSLGSLVVCALVNVSVCHQVFVCLCVHARTNTHTVSLWIQYMALFPIITAHSVAAASNMCDHIVSVLSHSLSSCSCCSPIISAC